MFLVFYGSALLSNNIGLLAQDAPRTIERARTNINDPVGYAGFLFDDQEVQHGVSFQAAGDWLEHVVVVVENRSAKDLIALQIMLSFPELGRGDSTHTVLLVPMIVGQIPEHALYTTSGRKIAVAQHPAIDLKPGQTVRIPVADVLSEIAKMVPPAVKISDLTRCSFWISDAYFADQTKWFAGTYSRPDPQTKGSYIPITREEFIKGGSN
jgi:hypothetical protein